MSAFNTRIQEDLRKVELLSRETDGRVKLVSTTGNPVRELIIELAYPTAGSTSFPNSIQHSTIVKIELLSRYPFQAPSGFVA